MGFGVVFVLLLVVSGWWLYSRWSDLRDSQARRREAEMLFVFEAKSQRPASAKPTASMRTPTEFRPTLPGER